MAQQQIIPVLTIAGSDASGGAGIQADLKTFLAHGVYGMSAVTALPAQNTLGVRAIQEAAPEFLAAELDAIFEDIPPRAVKVGMVASAALIRVIAEKLRAYHAEHVVVDPVMVATSGAPLLAGDAMDALKEELFPCAELLTPNLPELTRLTGIGIVSEAAMAAAAERAAQRFGAAVLATEAAMRCGAGLVTCASCEPVLNAVMDRVPEVLCAPFPSDEFGDMDYTGIEAGLEGKRAVLYGCGSGTPSGIGAAFFQGHAGQQDLTYILDASGLNYLADHIEWIPKGRTILTPHPGEAARLLGTDVDTVQADRPAAARRIAEMTGTVVVLKGAGTIITDGKRTAVCCDGNNGMAKAGSGDVLAGIISALAAQGMEPYDAACAGVMLHAAAGDLAAEELGQRYMLPQDLIAALQEVL